MGAPDVHFTVASGELRFYSGGITYESGGPFDHIIFVVADEDLAIFRGLRAETKFLVTSGQRQRIARTLMKHGFKRCAWDRYRPGRPCRRVMFDLARWASSASH